METAPSTFSELLLLCRQQMTPTDVTGKKLLDYIEKLYKRASPVFTASTEFHEKVRAVRTSVSKNPTKKFVFLKDLISDLKAYKVEKEHNPANKQTSSNGEAIDEAVTHMDHVDEKDGTAPSTSTVPGEKVYSEKTIGRFEEILKAHHKEIDRLEQLEISLADMEKEDSPHLVSERLKLRAAKLFRKICLMKKRREAMGGMREKKFKYTGCRYPEINSHIQSFINNQTLDERMPDYNDVLKIVRKCNNKYGYRLSNSRVNEMAKDIFTDVGSTLQKIRQTDFLHDFGPAEANRSLRTSTGDDPALFDKDLRMKLEENKKVAQKNLHEVLNKYSEQQALDLDQAQVSEPSGDESDSAADQHTSSEESDRESSSNEFPTPISSSSATIIEDGALMTKCDAEKSDQDTEGPLENLQTVPVNSSSTTSIKDGAMMTKCDAEKSDQDTQGSLENLQTVPVNSSSTTSIKDGAVMTKCEPENSGNTSSSSSSSSDSMSDKLSELGSSSEDSDNEQKVNDGEPELVFLD